MDSGAHSLDIVLHYSNIEIVADFKALVISLNKACGAYLIHVPSICRTFVP